ncbi:NEAT domain-containing protein (plasmid) [Bacillus cereus]|uniref:Cell surface protein n=1 Tax=Bacillus cereus (strain 03BB102) TaxID=572264 RepID=A0A125Y9V7_BACC3|nr:NEAT domain-containing protein [Bacillus cereus]ACO25697.1 cell surface protein [Bacillus cereus 03BB102]QPR80791.1 NEAT domain-containing protein [Bacillus cereus]
MLKHLKKIIAAFTILISITTLGLQITKADTLLADGKYTVNFKVLQSSNDNESRMNNYVKSPATLTVKNNKKYISFKVNSSSYIKSLRIKKGNKFVDTAVLEKNIQENSRIVEFEVDNLLNILDSKVHVKIPVIYDKTYDIRIFFDTNVFPIVK